MQEPFKVFARCDGNDQVGLGHVSRCFKIAQLFENTDIETIFLVASSSIGYIERVTKSVSVIDLGTPPSERADAYETLKVLEGYDSAKLLLIDSYQHSAEWESIVTSNDVYLVAIDDRLIQHKADIVINYRPGLRADQCQPALNQTWLTGAQYFPNTKAQPPKKHKNTKALFFCGGSSNYAEQSVFFETAIKCFASASLEIDLLVTTQESKCYLQHLIQQLPAKSHTQLRLIDYIDDLEDRISEYRWIIGPASTTLYEGLISGSIAISCALQPETIEQSESWLHAGHLLHLGHCKPDDTHKIEQFIHIAINKPDQLLELRKLAPDPLQNRTNTRLIEDLREAFTSGGKFRETFRNRQQHNPDGIRACQLTDIWRWLEARNQPSVRTISSDNDSISPKSHIDWWLIRDKHKFVVERDSIPVAYFWHQQHTDANGNFFCGGWFPAKSKSMTLRESVEIINFQLKFAQRFGGKNPTWIASMEPENKVSIALSERLGFVDATPLNRKRLTELFSGIKASTVLLERRL